ncbi:hypothetical protein LLEC1_03071 [Akanthomyces lecanii]|uniref:Aminoglycoside phosphotransferase domain-containing protein n=1 Tax=Cordyceps confragosa TaxID=2714763 RepID=A0A179I8W6_CORDF|nr:hypothetical protein LLEC1_03071 [Akanthomyces lecanii]
MLSRFFDCFVTGCSNPSVRVAGGCGVCERHLCFEHLQPPHHSCDQARLTYDATWKSHEMDEVQRLQGGINDAAVSNIVLELTGKECTIQHFNYDEGMMGCANYHARVSFSDGSNPWLLRVPRVSRVSTSLPRLLIDDLIRSEFATLKFLENLPIPTARAFAYGVTDDDHGVGVGFILMEELPGRPWPGAMAGAGSQHSVKIWQQLAETMAEIQKHPFPMAGSLMPDGASSVKVSAMVTDRFFILGPNGPFTTAMDYYTAYAEQYLELIADGQVYTAYPVNAYLLYSFLKEKANQVAADEEPTFFLKHVDDKGDHLLVDEHFNITGIIDWQGARVVPRQEAFGYSLVSADMGLLCSGKAGLGASDAAFAAASRVAAIRGGVGDDDKVRRYMWGLGSEAEWKHALPLAERLLEMFGVEMSWAEWKQEAVTAHYAGDARLRALLENVEKQRGNN